LQDRGPGLPLIGGSGLMHLFWCWMVINLSGSYPWSWRARMF